MAHISKAALVLSIAGMACLCSPAAAQGAEAADAAQEALALVEAHNVNMRIPCTVPIPAGQYAPAWEQEAAWRRAQHFSRCLDDVMEREQQRLSYLTGDVDDLHARAPDADWSAVESALDAKWDELDTLAGKLRIRSSWADAAITVVNAFAPPENPMYPSFPAGQSPYYYNGYRRDTSVSAPGIK